MRKGLSTIAVAAVTSCLTAWCESEGAGGPADKIALRVLYVGYPGSPREKDFAGLLERHFTKVAIGDLDKVERKDAESFDVVIVDYDKLTVKGNTIVTPRIPFDRDYSSPVVTVGDAGAFVCGRLGLKTSHG